MKLRILAGLMALAIATSACSFSSLIPFSNSNSNSSISQAVDPNTQPIPVTTTLDPSHAATAIIGPDGGTLSTTGADGTKFTLDIPAKALVETIEVTMTPITAMDGLPWKSGPVAAVQLEPDGQTFYGFVTLTIEPAADIPIDQVIPIGASGPGHALYIPAVDPNSKSLQLKLDHFSSAGATKGLLADVEPWRQRLGGDAEARINSLVAQELGRDRQLILMGQEPPDDTAFIAEMRQAYIQYVLKPRLAAAGTNCAAGRLAIQTVLGMQRQAELLGTTFDTGVNTTDLIVQVGKVCLQEEYQLCKDQHIVHRIIPVVLGIARQNELLGVHDANQDASAQALADLEAQGWDLARKCLHFELQFQSTETMSTADGKYTATVEATVPIELGSDIISGLTGSADLVPTDYSPKVQNCSFRSTLSNGTFKVVSLAFIDAPPDSAHPYGYVKAIHLTYAPGSDTEVTTETCPGVPPVTFPPMHMWSIGYQALHIMDMAGGDQGAGNSLPNIGSILGGMGMPSLPNIPGMPQLPGGAGSPQGGSNQGSSQDNGTTFLAKEWAVRGGDLYASKQWDLTVNLTTTGEESGTFKLYHKPQ